MICIGALICAAGGLFPARAEPGGPNTIYLQVSAAVEMHVDREVLVEIARGPGDEILWGWAGDREWPIALIRHVPPSTGRAGLSVDREIFSLRFGEQGGKWRARLGISGQLEAGETKSVFLAIPGGRLLSWTSGTEQVDGLREEVGVSDGATSIPVAGADDSTGAALGPLAAGTGRTTFSSPHPILGEVGWVECLGTCSFAHVYPDGRRVRTTAHGDPVFGWSAISDGPPTFAAGAGTWTLEWRGTFVRNSILDEAYYSYVGGISEPVAFIYFDATGIVIPGTWYPEEEAGEPPPEKRALKKSR